MDKIQNLRTKLDIINSLDVQFKDVFDDIAQQYDDTQLGQLYINILDLIEDTQLDIAGELSKEKYKECNDEIGFKYNKVKDIEMANKYHKVAKVNIDGEDKFVKLNNVELVDYEDGIRKVE